MCVGGEVDGMCSKVLSRFVMLQFHDPESLKKKKKNLALSPLLTYCVALSQILDLSGPIFTSGISGD